MPDFNYNDIERNVIKGRAMIAIAKEKISKLVEKQPDDSSYDDIMKELIFAHMIDRGLDDSNNNRITSHENMKNEIMSWSK